MGKYHLISIAILLIAVQFNFTSLVAQELERVEIRMKDGSVMKGLIPFKSELRNLSDFNFYKNRNVDPIKINPTGIDSLKINNFSFVCAEISVESSSNRKKELSNKKDPIMRTDHAFLLPIVTGPKSLYYYRDKEGKEHFVFKNGEKYESFIYKKYADYYGTVIRMRENRMYIGQLIQYLATPNWRVDFSSYTYELDKLQELFLFYYRVNALEPDYIYEEKDQKKRKKKKR